MGDSPWKKIARGLGRVLIGFAVFMRHLLRALSPLISIPVALVLIVVIVLWQLGFFDKPLPPDQQVAETELYCAQLAGYDDGATNDERLAMAVATLNLARERHTSTCDIYESFAALIGPTKQPLFGWWRKPMTMYTVSRLGAENKAAFNQSGLLLEAYRKDPAPYQKRFPWLSCVTHYKRSTWVGFTPWRDDRLDSVMRNVWTSPTANMRGQHAEFFCPLEKSSLNLKPPDPSGGLFFTSDVERVQRKSSAFALTSRGARNQCIGL